MVSTSKPRFAASIALALLCVAPWVHAGPNDRAAKKLLREAIDEDFLATNFDSAIAKIQEGLALCESGCARKTRAELHLHLGFVYVVGLGEEVQGEEQFKQALRFDRRARLDPGLESEEVRIVFERARGAGPESAPAERGEPERPRRRKRAEKREPRLEIEPVERQRRGTPVPVYVEPTGKLHEAKVRLHYRPLSADRWQGTDLHRRGDGYAGYIPCEVVAAAETLEYYVDAVDEDDEPVATAGGREAPFEVELVDKLDEPPPRLPGLDPPEACGEEAGGASGRRRVWIGGGFSQDFAMTSGSEVCTMDSQVSGGYNCFRPQGSQYHGTPLSGGGGKIHSGVIPAQRRLWLEIAWQATTHFGVGLRAGYGFGGGPGADGGSEFFPWLVETSLSYWFAGRGGSISPMVFVAGGLVQIDAHTTVTVHEDTSVPPPANQTDNPPQQNLDVYQRFGGSFASAGAGIFFPLGSRVGLLADARAIVLFPDTGVALGVDAGCEVGF